MSKNNYSNKEKDINNEVVEYEHNDESIDLYENVVEDLFEKYANKMDRMFVKGVYSFDIQEQLNSLSKESIYSVARNLGMSKISTLNKDNLIEKVLSEYKSLIERQFIFFEEERYKILKSYMNNGGIKIFDEIDEYEMGKTAYFMQQGIIFPSLKDEKAVFLMPDIVQNLIQERDTLEYKELMKINGEILNIYRGLNKAYGIIEINNIKEILERYNIKNLEKYKVEQIIREGQYYYREYREEKGIFVNNNIQNWSELLEDIYKENKKLNYSIISKDELISMLDDNWIYKTKFGKVFLKEFTDIFDIQKDMAIQIMKDLSFDIQDNDSQETVNGLLELIDENNTNLRSYIRNITIKFVNNIRLWKYKGAAINQIEGNLTTLKSEKTVGRNEPCTCGSGKKYKKCCGKN